jgi:gluconate:H+ symporter, GntP family
LRAAKGKGKISMYGMPLSQALVFVAAAALIIGAARRIHPFIVLTVVAAAFGAIAGYPTSQLGSAFGSGFSEKIHSPGLVVVAASVIAGLAEGTSAVEQLSGFIARQRLFAGNRLAAAIGLLAGLGASPASAFALTTPLLPAIGGIKEHDRSSATLTVALAISASHGVAVLTPVSIAAIAILGAPWSRAALFGLPLAIVLGAFGALYARWLLWADAAPRPAEPERAQEPRGTRSSAVLVLAIAVPLLALIEQSLGAIPSEPLGGGTTRELIIGVGRPLILFLVGLGIMIVGQPRHSISRLIDPDWGVSVFGRVGGILLVICAAGGLQRLCQQTGMAEMVGERVLGWHFGAFGVLIPFLVAATIKTLQGSSLVAAITTAGMAQPLLQSLGIADIDGRTLAALAIGAGAMTVAHVNDEYFWLVADRAGLTPPRGLAAIAGGTLLQGLLSAALLVAISLVTAHV